jgi:hypothetical protein
MSTWVVQLLIVAIFALACGVLAFAWMRGRLGATALVLFAVCMLVWIGAFVGIAKGLQGADEFATCLDDCRPIHYAAAVAFIAPPLLAALAAVAMLVSRGQRWRARRALAEQNHGSGEGVQASGPR